ncbi:MAG TPA: radical SAM protein [Terriglobales bacterium]|nr:radical SAM protein [Terriglobales bacterium]
MTTTPAKFRIDDSMNDLLMNRYQQPSPAAADKGVSLPEPVFPRFPLKLLDPGPIKPPERRTWTTPQILRKMRGWLVPYLRSRILPGDFHPITSYLFVEYKCNLDCWYCPSYNNQVKGMTEDVARRSIDWLHDHGGRVLGLMGGEPLLRPEFIHKVVYYATKKGMWVYIGTNARLLNPTLAARLGDAGVAVFNVAVDAWDEKPGLPKALVPIRRNLEYLLRKQYVYGYMVFFNINICRNNHDDVKQLTDWAHDHRIATDYHINETPMLDQSDHFKHLENNPTYLRPEDWTAVDGLVDWLVERHRAGYQMVNSVQRLLEMKTFMRMSSGLDLKEVGWNGDGTGDVDKMLAALPGLVQSESGDLQFADWNCRAGQNNVVVRTDGTVAPCFPLYPATFHWGNIDSFAFDSRQLKEIKAVCQRHCFSTLNHNLAYCYNDGRVIRWIWQAAKRGFKGGGRAFE